MKNKTDFSINQLCEYGSSSCQCKNIAKWHVTNGWGFDKKICTTHKKYMERRGYYSFAEKLNK